MKKLILILFFFATTIAIFPANNYKYWVQFTNKNSSSFSITDPSDYLSSKAIARRIKHDIVIDSTDLPVNQNYIDSVLAKGVSLVSRSRWLNGITISVPDSTVISQINNLPFVKKVELTFIPNYLRKAKIDLNNYPSRRVNQANDGYGNAFAQINMHNGNWLHQAGYKGEGIVIAVLDAGFLHVNTIPAFSQAFNNGQILGTKDFVEPGSDVYTTHYHGGQVLSVMAGYDYNNYIGTAPDASYWLIRTEDSDSEFPVEADNLVAALEYADSVGVDIITASLGYFNFDNPVMSYTYANMDGLTCRASLAEKIASFKGLIILNSAGNEGANPWHYVTAPADADGIITVGSVLPTLTRSSFSSWGPTSDGRIKPTVCALGSSTAVINSAGSPATNSGTSLACPIIAGLTACLWQSLPNLSNTEIMELIKKNGNQRESPTNEIGYGIPDFYAAYTEGARIYKNIQFNKDEVKMYPNPTGDGLHLDIKPSIFSRKLSFVLISMNGKKVLSERIRESSTEFSLIRIKPGIYTVLIKSNDDVLYREKLIKK
jgi:serine protease AprX